MEVNMTYLVLKPNSVNNVWTDLVYVLNEGDTTDGIDYGHITENPEVAYKIAWMVMEKYTIEHQ